MGAEGQIDWRQAAASALAWWDDAGLDTLVDEETRDWLAPVVVAPAAATRASVAVDALPADIQAFLAWRVGDAAPESGWPGGWVSTSGPADAAVMVLVDCPDRGDDGDGLLSGAPGRLFERMLAAVGLSRDTVHLASVCAKRPTAGRTPAGVEARLAAIAAHHVSLVAPKRLLLLGNAASRAILGMETRAARGILHRFNPDRRQQGDEQGADAQTGVIASYHPRFLLDKPAAKAATWVDLQVLMKGLG